MSRYYITTPIYYPNAEPHIGHAYTTIAADTLARYHRLAGDDTYLLTGTDEHGIKMVKTAAAENVEPIALADRVVCEFERVWKELDITHDDFIRTTQPRHKLAVQKIVQQLLDNGDIYLGAYEGWYDEGQEEFVPENTAKEQEYKSAISGRPLVRYKEPSYFFRLAKYAPKVLEYIKSHPEFVQPATRRNEVISKLEAGVEDLSISRATLTWGIQMPNDPQHVVYVWIDALSNYVTALGYGSDDDSKFKQYWPADLHLIGKEILWFHAVYWPAMLFSLGLPVPKHLFAHGWWTADGKKMSKSMGNFVDIDKLRELGKAYSLDAVRFYLLRAAPFGADLDWTGRKEGTDVDFHKAFNELANVIGNCLNRTLNMAGKYRGQLPPLGELEDIDRNLIDQTKRLGQQLADAYAKFELQQCALLPIELARTTNGYIDATAPFKLAKDAAKASRLDTVLHVSSQAIFAALVGLLPMLPEKAAAGLKQLGVSVQGKTIQQLLEDGLAVGHPIAPGQPLFPKVEGAK
jgi:methionyl-tRNA synthetase